MTAAAARRKQEIDCIIKGVLARCVCFAERDAAGGVYMIFFSARVTDECIIILLSLRRRVFCGRSNEKLSSFFGDQTIPSFECICAAKNAAD